MRGGLPEKRSMKRSINPAIPCAAAAFGKKATTRRMNWFIVKPNATTAMRKMP